MKRARLVRLWLYVWVHGMVLVSNNIAYCNVFHFSYIAFTEEMKVVKRKVPGKNKTAEDSMKKGTLIILFLIY